MSACTVMPAEIRNCQIVSEHKADYDTISRHAHDITRTLKTIESLHKTFDWSHNVLEALDESYALILQYFAAVSRTYSTRGKKILHTFVHHSAVNKSPGSVLGIKSLTKFGSSISKCKGVMQELNDLLTHVRDISAAAESQIAKRRHRGKSGIQGAYQRATLTNEQMISSTFGSRLEQMIYAKTMTK